MFRAVQNSLLSLFYPQQCRVCGLQVEDRENGVACAACWASTRIFTGTEMLCRKCGAFMGDDKAPTPVLCHRCDDHFYDRATAVGVYEKALAASIVNLKTVPALPESLRAAAIDVIQGSYFEGTDILIPVPLSRQRQTERGFNQAEIIAAAVSRSTGFPVDASSLARKIHTRMHRAGMDKKAREATVRNAFTVVRPRLISGKNILLVDDVFTSGATASFCAKILKKTGAASVNVFTLARAVFQ